MITPTNGLDIKPSYKLANNLFDIVPKIKSPSIDSLWKKAILGLIFVVKYIEMGFLFYKENLPLS
ncbi:hypothetical protein BKP45_16015 [Anaerobacillus alkalidiazotrophicus]|uniref:Uncharacterized protein n=1 Tax=Anaerobacillus alkalidiazotrophicus TaxID=472963 RepID=A0A1S2M3Z1_9BACI|nr:hypothetical protein BKP45_16015 [Anaerobacillus alkalidiazotrophicus]